MIQDILTFLTILAALGVTIYRISRAIRMAARGETPGCGSCPLHQKGGVDPKSQLMH